MLSSIKNKIYRLFSILVLLAAFQLAYSQGVKLNQADWQQEVDYQIKVTLDDIHHMVMGDLSINYVNNSPDELTYIIMHLWPNAYKNNNTAFAKQLLGNGDVKFYFAIDEERGWIDSIDFKVNGKAVKWSFDPDHIDIARIDLEVPLKQGERLFIETPFKVKIPGSFSRFGHEGKSYQITQWYPKPAVYDVNGWNPMPYLDQGEFYSEFGSFEVAITLPKEYVVSATGELQEQDEWSFLKDREANPLIVNDNEKKKGETGPVYTSSEMKTITFIQDNIHDFAWFADPAFNVSTDKICLPSGDSVELMLFTNKKYSDKDLVQYLGNIKATLNYYSKYIGGYPYKYCSVVQGALKSGGGMEYPMVTVIPALQEEIIVHEVGHNWFYGILGTNERSYPWMDEAINSYYEELTIKNETNPLGEPHLLKEMQGMEHNLARAYISELERKWEHQPIGAHSEIFTNSNYGMMIYQKGSQAFNYLGEYLGLAAFDKAIQSYFEQWKFRHPLPGDLKSAFEDACEKDLSWFFDDYLMSDGILDYSIEYVDKNQGKATIKNNGQIIAPFPLDYIRDDNVVLVQWIDGFSGEKEISLVNGEYTALKIDSDKVLGETYLRNNTYSLNSKWPKFEKVKRNAFFAVEDPDRTQITLTTAAGWNMHDGYMIGLGLTNIRVPRKNLEFIGTPMYAFRSETITGYGQVRYSRFYKSGTVSSSQVGVGLSRFSHEMAGIFNDKFTYSRVSPYVRIDFSKPYPRSKKERSIMLRGTWVSFDPFNSDEEKLNTIRMTDTSRRSSFLRPNARSFVNLTYEVENKRALNPYSFKLDIETGMISNSTKWLDSSKTTDDEIFTKVEFTGNYRITYPFYDKGLDIRVFVGAFIKPVETSAFQFGYNNANTVVAQPDYKYEYSQMGRGAGNGLFTHQLIEGGPYLKNIGMISMADEWIAAVNLETGLPFKLPVGVYLDLFTSNNIDMIAFNEDESIIGYSGGLDLNLFKGFIKIYVPFVASPFIKDAQEFYGIHKWKHKISFALNLNLLEPFSARDKLSDIF